MQDDKPISLAGSKKWIYQTNNSKDSTPPEIVNASTDFKVGFSDTNLFQASDSASVETNPWKNIKYMDKNNKNLLLIQYLFDIHNRIYAYIMNKHFIM